MAIAFLFVLVLLAPYSSTANNVDVVSFLSRYGYLEESQIAHGGAIVDVSPALREFQEFYGLAPTGKMDTATIGVMRTPRCGMGDKSPRRSRRGIISKWEKESLLYFVESRPPYLDPHYVDGVVWGALAAWQNVSRLSFFPARSKEDADIVIGFPGPEGHSSCTSRFGPTDLAHAFYPPHGRVHFNMDFRWDDLIRLNAVTVHEFGHSIGLAHSPDPSSVMFALHTSTPKKITTNEINELREIYGSREGVHWVEEDEILRETVEEAATPPDPCGDGPVDAILRRRGEYVFFKGGWCWRFTRDTARVVGPYRIGHFYRGLSRVDAAVEVDDDVYLFSGAEVYIETRGVLTAPRSLPKIGIRDSDRIGAAFTWHGVNFEGDPGIYLLDGQQAKYYRFDEGTSRVHVNYPRATAIQWPDAPLNADDVFEYGEGNDLIFVKDGLAYMLNITSTGMTQLVAGYPVPVSSLFRACALRSPSAVSQSRTARYSASPSYSHLSLVSIVILLLVVLVL